MNSSPGTQEPPSLSDQSRWFSEEVHAHDSSLRAYLRGSFPAVRDLDDVVQESYLRILRARPAGRIASGRAFLFRVARNLALNLLRRNRASPVEAVPDLARLPVLDVSPDAADFACSQESLRLLAEAIDSLPPRCREIVILRRIRNVPQREIAAQLGISVETVEQQVARGVRHCAEYMLRRSPESRP